MSEAKIVEMLESDMACMGRLNRINNAKHQPELLRVAILAIEEKSRMLISLGAQKRPEMDMRGLKITAKASICRNLSRQTPATFLDLETPSSQPNTS